MTRLEEISLVARCVGFDDRRAFARLVDEYHQPLLRFLTGMCGDEILAAAHACQKPSSRLGEG